MPRFERVIAALLLCCCASACGGELNADEGTDAAEEFALTASSSGAFKPVTDSKLELLVALGLAGHTPIITAITKATKSVKLAMFHLTDKNVVQALVDAQARGVAVKVILDSGSLSNATYAAAYNSLLAGKVAVVKSSSAFSLMHEKAMVVDGKVAYILTMNMTNERPTPRDFGLVLHSAAAVKEWNAVFDADFQNAANQTGTTPALTDAAMVWSPVNAESRLTSLINSAKTSLDVTTENITDKTIVAALGAAVARGVNVRLLVPACAQNWNPLLNYPALSTLQAAGVQAHVMPSPPSTSAPYMHAKMILVDGTVAFLGSMNLTADSLNHAREAGVIFKNAKAAATLGSTFDADWMVSSAVPATTPTCP